MLKRTIAAFQICLCLVAVAACKVTDPAAENLSGLNALATGSARPEDVKSRIDPATGKVTFYYLYDGMELNYQPMHEGDVLAQKKAEGRWILTYRGVQIGEKQGELLKICDKYDIDGQPVIFPCNAIFYHQEKHPAKDQNGQYSERFMMDISLGELPASGLNLTQNERINLASYAQNQINQYGTGTCYYNSMTGILEMFYSMKTGQPVDLSEPDLLAKFAARTDEEQKYLGVARAGELSLLKNEDLPVTRYYGQNSSFYGVQAAAERDGAAARQRGAKPVALSGLQIKATKLFWYGLWQRGYTTEADFKKAANWLMEKRQPVHLQHVVNGYWHAVIMMGYDPATQSVLIKDSLGNSNLKGTWKSKAWFMQYTYGAVGAESQEAANVANRTNPSTPPNTQVPSSIAALIGGSLGGSADTYTMWLAAPKTTSRLVFCAAASASTCAPGSAGYTTTMLRSYVGDQALYQANAGLTLSPNLQILVVAYDANGQVLASRKLRFEAN